MNEILDAGIVGPRALLGLGGVCVLVLAVLLVPWRRHGGSAMRRLLWSGGAAVTGAVVGWVLLWLVGDVANVFGVVLSVPTRLWVIGALAGIGIAVTALVRGGWGRRVVGIVAIPLLLLTGAAGVNAVYGQFPTLRAALGISRYPELDPTPDLAAVPARGEVGRVVIPATTSGFPARDALVYLPPAALTTNPPSLPVVQMMSGQPGSPEDVFGAGHLAGILDSYAAANDGVAPIVVVPDQLGAPDKNPMCVDSPLGDAASYLTIDVPTWIRSTLHVDPAPGGWAIAGFSQGATCAIQLGAAHPELYGTVFAVSSEIRPTLGNDATTIEQGFGGDAAAYAAAAPTAILARNAPYSDFTTIFAVGADDAQYLDWATTLDAAAAAAGATSSLLVSPGTAHDWYTVQYAWRSTLPTLMERLTLGPTSGGGG
ncbi:alpha/beta hydrolase [Compostimonas suwonensis]|uniref:S-formylglutathione hydrolase FrmB n=1 Tax=Compostimonas suwonensis TaxID=1048394 RepID=A0A2M9C4W2_9MICO|nr:alpha/beta hydrolase-fold protein [Compostimonas suwonensis]PJJ65571.1 S-formylglutathione hydrolase FrmB [Compostimonas suwonensis]